MSSAALLLQVVHSHRLTRLAISREIGIVTRADSTFYALLRD